jgi:hypothetical protein
METYQGEKSCDKRHNDDDTTTNNNNNNDENDEDTGDNVNTFWLATAEMLLTQSRTAGNGGPSLRAGLTVSRTSMLRTVAAQILCTN